MHKIIGICEGPEPGSNVALIDRGVEFVTCAFFNGADPLVNPWYWGHYFPYGENSREAVLRAAREDFAERVKRGY